MYDRLGDVYTRAGKYQEAQEALAKALSLDTSRRGHLSRWGRCDCGGMIRRASLLYLQHAEKMDPGNYMTHTLLGQAYRSLGREEEAKKQNDMASKIHAENELKLQPVQ